MNQFRAFLAAVLLAVATLSAAPALAGIERVPQAGSPAWAIDVPADVQVDRDADGNLSLFPPNMTGFVMLQVVAGEGADAYTLDQLAGAVLEGAKARPATRSEPVVIDGLTGAKFYSTLQLEGHPPVNFHVYVVKIDATHVGVMVVMAASDLTPAQIQRLDQLARSVRISRAVT